MFARSAFPPAVVPNTIDRRAFRYRVRDLRRRPLRLLSTRNFEPLYNVACTLRAFALVQARFPDASLTLVGSGSQEAALEGARGEPRAAARHVRRPRGAAEIAGAYYEAADIYVQTPSIDNMPLSVLEAFASGLPVVSTDVGGVSAVLTAGVHGLLARRQRSPTVAARIIELHRAA